MNEEEVHQWAMTLEGRRQLIWAARREGYLLAIRDLETHGDEHYAAAARWLNRYVPAEVPHVPR